MTDFRDPVAEIRADRMCRSETYTTRAEDAINNRNIPGVDSDLILHTLYDPLKKRFELYLIADGGYYPEASWYIGSKLFTKMLYNIEFQDTYSKKHSDYLLLVWDTEFPTSRDEPIAKSFLNAVHAVRLAAYFPRASGVACIKGSDKDIGFDDISG